jgi:enoyl-CoA hydratase/carnithine racemase
MNRPKRRNSFSEAHMRELIAALCAAAYLTLVNSISVVLGLLKNARRCGRTAVHV